jgi:hypothetical protein
MIAPFASATEPSLNQAERQPIKSNLDENPYERQQMFNAQYIKMSANGASTICGHLTTEFHH